MDLDHRPHFRTTSTGHNSNTTTTTNELFICFTSRLSSSSMKLTKSILSPARAARDGSVAAAAASVGPVSLSSSLSRRLRSNGSLKGGASPFLSTAGKRRGAGAGFENPEPSSPKVTCIGQVRVKTKKKVKQTRSLSKRRSGEMSFRKTEHQPTSDNNSGGGGDKDSIAGNHQQIRYSSAGGAHYQQQPPAQECLPHRNQRWVHLPVSICEALRDFSCLFPCKSSCFSRAESKQAGSGEENGCGTVFARWLVSVNDGEGGKRREIELVVGGGDDEEEEVEAERVSMRSSRRHVFDDIEVKDGDRIEIKGQGLEDGDCEEKGRVSICIPPKNALLLMRCRSDPMKMASLANRFSWDAAQGVCGNVCEKNDVQVEKQEVVSEEQGNKDEEVVIEKVVVVDENNEEQRILDVMEQEILELMKDGEVGKNLEVENELLVIRSEEMVEEIEKEEEGGLEQEIEEKLVENEDDEEEVESNMSSFEDLLDQENTENYEDSPIEEEKNSSSICHFSPPTESDVEINQISPVLEEQEGEVSMEKENEESNIIVEEKDSTFANSEENWVKPDPETTQQEEGEENCELMDKRGNQDFFEEPKKEKILPDCLLLMMCEPKLSMEVSKETWVCSTDFIRWMPERPRKAVAAAAAKAGVADQGPVKRRLSTDSKPNKPPIRGNYEKPRSSCSLPAAAASMAAVIEQKLVNAVGYEPFVLTRCKSEPMKTAAAKLMPESCLIWKNAVRKMEPHRRAAVGVGAAGVGY